MVDIRQAKRDAPAVELMPHVAELPAQVPAPLVGDFLSKLHYLSEDLDGFEMDLEGRSHVRFRLRSGALQAASVVASRIAETATKMTRAYRAADDKLLVSRVDRAVPFDGDPHPELEKADELVKYGAGRFGLGPRLSALTAFFDGRIAELAREFPAPTYQFPSLIGADTLDRCRYIKSFPHSLNLVAHLREDLAAIQHFSQTVRWDGAQLVCSPEDLAGVKTLLSPSVCFHYYAWLHDRVLEKPTSITAIGKCFRYESGNLGGLERLWDFSMREVIFVGPRDHVLAERQRALELTTVLLDEWGLRYEIKSATDPFFIDDFATQATFQLAFDLKFEIRAALPYKDSTLAAGSFNYHQDFFGRSFNISDSSGTPVHTGCIGFGLERLALAFLAQYGFDSKRWPDSVARAVTW